jgi:hypothetical protein
MLYQTPPKDIEHIDKYFSAVHNKSYTMADTAHASSRTSSLVQALNAAHVDKDSFVVGMQKSTAPSFRETTEIYSSSEFTSAHAVNAGGNI